MQHHHTRTKPMDCQSFQSKWYPLTHFISNLFIVACSLKLKKKQQPKSHGRREKKIQAWSKRTCFAMRNRCAALVLYSIEQHSAQSPLIAGYKDMQEGNLAPRLLQSRKVNIWFSKNTKNKLLTQRNWLLMQKLALVLFVTSISNFFYQYLHLVWLFFFFPFSK